MILVYIIFFDLSTKREKIVESTYENIVKYMGGNYMKNEILKVEKHVILNGKKYTYIIEFKKIKNIYWLWLLIQN